MRYDVQIRYMRTLVTLPSAAPVEQDPLSPEVCRLYVSAIRPTGDGHRIRCMNFGTVKGT